MNCTKTPYEPVVSYFGPFCLHDKARLLERSGEPVKLGSRAMDILRLLVNRAGEVVLKKELIAHAWPGFMVEDTTLRVHIAELRKKLGDGKAGARYLTNVPMRGYCFVAPVHREPTPARSTLEEASRGLLPHCLERIIGREDALEHLSNRLASERFVTIIGPGGIGKTTVAVALAHGMWTAFDGQVRFVDLADLKDSALVAGTVASALRLVIHHADPTASIINFLRDQRLLLVLDNCEHVIEAVARLAKCIYQQASGISILATSRESLLVEGEKIFELDPLQGPPQGARLSASEVMSYPAARLFLERAVAAGYRATITEDDADVLVQICGRLDGIPLAIELAAVRVCAHGLREIAALLASRLMLEWRGMRTAPPRHQTLRANLDWSHSLITESERLVLRRLAIFPGLFTLQGAVAVACDEGEPIDCTVDVLAQLVAKSLVHVEPEGDPARFRLLDVIKAYARQKLAESGEAECIDHRYARYVQATVESSMVQPNEVGEACSSGERGNPIAP